MSTAVDRSRWSRPLVGLASVAVVGAGMGAFFGIRAVQGAGSAPSGGQPPARTEAAMAYDPANGTVVLFGGQSRFNTLHDTWIWNGSGWSQPHPRTAPPPLSGAQMTYDPVSHDVLLIGDPQFESVGPIACSAGSGTASSGSVGSNTTVVPPVGAIPADAPLPSPTGNAGHGTVGTPPICATVVSQGPATWLWNGSDWSKASATPPSIGFGNSALATDPVSGRVVLLPRGPFAVPALGAAEPAIACPIQNPASHPVRPTCPWPFAPIAAWTWNGHQWKTMATSVNTQSFELFNSSIVDDAVSGKLATFSGGNVAQPVPAPLPCTTCLGVPNGLQPSAAATGSEAVWTGTTWRQVITYSGGPAMPGAALVGDPATHSDIALSGNGQTWIWTGVWTRAHPGTTPPLVSAAAAVFDAATGQVVVFGGAGTTSHQAGLYNQTWTWDGSSWTQRGGSAGISVVIPEPSPVSIPPCPPVNPAAKPAQGAQTSAAQPAVACPGGIAGSIGGASGSAGSVTGVTTGSGAVAP
ncbi:MAG: hypothetical protein WB805_00650 [Candidatus Dormiibacterota bacterium]